MSDNENSGGPGDFDDEEFDFLDEGEDFETSAETTEPEIAAKPEPKAKPAMQLPPKKVMYIAGGGLAFLVVLVLMFTGGSDEIEMVAEPEKVEAPKEQAAKPEMSQEDMAKAFGGAQGDQLSEAAKPEDMVTDFSQIQEDLFGPGDVPPTPAPPPIAGIPDDGVPEAQVAGVSQEALDTVSQEIDTNEMRIQELQGQLMAISKTLANVNQSIQKVDNRVGGLSDAMDTMNTDLVRMKKIITDEELDLSADKKERDAKAAMLFRTPKYVVHAIIPGRAWLKSTEGQIVTVTEGDTLGDYGKVAAIDAGEGLVLTTSGMAFR